MTRPVGCMAMAAVFGYRSVLKQNRSALLRVAAKTKLGAVARLSTLRQCGTVTVVAVATGHRAGGHGMAVGAFEGRSLAPVAAPTLIPLTRGSRHRIGAVNPVAVRASDRGGVVGRFVAPGAGGVLQPRRLSGSERHQLPVLSSSRRGVPPPRAVAAFTLQTARAERSTRTIRIPVDLVEQLQGHGVSMTEQAGVGAELAVAFVRLLGGSGRRS